MLTANTNTIFKGGEINLTEASSCCFLFRIYYSSGHIVKSLGPMSIFKTNKICRWVLCERMREFEK